jgi:hypothetical protein
MIKKHPGIRVVPPGTEQAARPLSDVQHFEIPPDTYVALMNALATRPYIEVEPVISQIERTVMPVLKETVVTRLSEERRRTLDLVDIAEVSITALRAAVAAAPPPSAENLIDIIRATTYTLERAAKIASAAACLDVPDQGEQHGPH